MTPVSHPPYSPDLALSDIFVSLDEKSPSKETFCRCGRGETKNDRSSKRRQNRRGQKLFRAVGKTVSIGVLHQMESTLKVTEV